MIQLPAILELVKKVLSDIRYENHAPVYMINTKQRELLQEKYLEPDAFSKLVIN